MVGGGGGGGGSVEAVRVRRSCDSLPKFTLRDHKKVSSSSLFAV